MPGNIKICSVISLAPRSPPAERLPQELVKSEPISDDDLEYDERLSQELVKSEPLSDDDLDNSDAVTNYQEHKLEIQATQISFLEYKFKADPDMLSLTDALKREPKDDMDNTGDFQNGGVVNNCGRSDYNSGYNLNQGGNNFVAGTRSDLVNSVVKRHNSLRRLEHCLARSRAVWELEDFEKRMEKEGCVKNFERGVKHFEGSVKKGDVKIFERGVKHLEGSVKKG